MLENQKYGKGYHPDKNIPHNTENIAENKVDTSAQGSVMPEQNEAIGESEKPDTKVPPSFIDVDGKTGTPQNDTDPSKSYHGIPVTTKQKKHKASNTNAEEGVHAENIGSASEEG